MARVNLNQLSIAFTAVYIFVMVLLIAIIAELRGKWSFDLWIFVLLLLLMLIFPCYDRAPENSPTKAILKISMVALVVVFITVYLACRGAMSIRVALDRMIGAACPFFIICAVICFVLKNWTNNPYPVSSSVWISIALFCSFLLFGAGISRLQALEAD